jgi:YfiH family protein
MGNSDITVHEFDHLKNHNNIIHGIFARSGRTGTEQFDSLNISINSGDKKSVIADNQKLIIKKMGMKPLIFLNQVHGTEIKILKKAENDLFENFQPGKEVYTADGIITDITDVFLVIQVADCQAVVLYDYEKRVIANIHSGWKGSVKNIIGKCVAKMLSEFGCNSDNIIAGISPSLGPCCSEFVNYKYEIPESLWKYKIEGKDYFDFWEMSCDQLMDKGIKRANIENMGICTRCNMDKFYSYRGEKTTDRFVCVISLI